MPESIPAAGWRLDNAYARLPDPLFAAATPAAVRAPRLVVVNEPLAADLGLDPAAVRDSAAVLAGNALPPGAEPIAQAYAGHQFGHFTNLGDGRAILLGEQRTPAGRRFDIQLKGAGRTRYSRGGDGRAALGPMLREHLISEAMHALGVPTTRSLAVAMTGEVVMRTTPLPGAVLTRVATSHIRVGTFQYARALGDEAVLRALLDHAIARHDPDLIDVADPALAFLEAVVARQAALVARWMLVGFVHGVMNTDNMAVSGETIDYGPCAFLDTYDPATVFSSIDQQGRYAYGNQPAIAQWNLARLAESLLPLFAVDEEQAIAAVREVLERFADRYQQHYDAGARAKLGLGTEAAGDRHLFATLLDQMHRDRADFTGTFAGLAQLAERPLPAVLPPGISREWLTQWRERLAREPGEPAEMTARMQQTNPLVIPRNHKVEEALAAAEIGDGQPLHSLLAAIQRPFEATAINEPFRCGPPAGCGPYRTFCGT
jgi:uncharacterized protein YdiU (UPF0061 family)